jgi:serine/threonine protein phosphatase PrpC
VTITLDVSGETNVGMKRTHNEDNFAYLKEENLFVVCDGMGGHASGEVASQMAVETLRNFFKETREDPELTWPYKMDRSKRYQENRLITGIKLANLRIHEASKREKKYHGMGTTIVSTFFVDEGVYLAHVGDSRIYRIRDGLIEQVTDDHSLLNDYIKMKKLSPQEIENFPHKNVIVRALGMKESVKVDTFYEVPKPGDVYLLCSDGLSGEMSDPQMLEVFEANSSDLQVASHALIERANSNGGHDNVTVVLVKVQ